jgi:integrase
MNDDKVFEWFGIIDAAEGTQKVYEVVLKEFCEYVGKTPTELIDEAISEVKQGLLPSERSANKYLLGYRQKLKNAKLAEKTINTKISIIKSFFKAFDLPMSERIKTRKALPRKENRNFLTKDDVKKLIINAKNLRDKAIILVMATSGMARNEILNLRIRDIEFDDNDIGTVRVRREKAQVDYVTFISPEATKALREYFDERNRHPETKIKGDDDFVFVTYPSGGKHGGMMGGRQISPTTFSITFQNLGKELGYDNDNGFVKTRSHALRKFFASTLETAGMPKNKIDFMLGHSPSGNDLAYFNMDIDNLRELYKAYLPHITFEKEIVVHTADERIKDLMTKNKNLEDKLKQLEEGYSLVSEFMEMTKKHPTLLQLLKSHLASSESTLNSA